jgi:hypothetical protein
LTPCRPGATLTRLQAGKFFETEDLSGTTPASVGIGRQEVAERQEDPIRRLFGGRPDAQKVGAQGGASV